MLRAGLPGQEVVPRPPQRATLRWSCCGQAGGGAGGPGYPEVDLGGGAFLVEVGMLQQDLVTCSPGSEGRQQTPSACW